MAKDNIDDIIGGVNLGGLTDYLFVFTDGSQDANWQGATKGFIGDVAVDGVQASERTSGGVPFSGMLYTNDVSADAWQDIVDQNPGTATVSTGETDLIDSLEADLSSAFEQIDALTVTSGYESVDASDLNGLNTQNGIAEIYVINVTSGFNVDYTIDVTGDADDVYILRWDEDADPTNGYQGTVKFQSGGGINPLGDLSPSNFINVAGDINASGGGSTPSGLIDDVGELDGVGGGGFFTGYWLTTGDPTSGDTQSLSNAIFTGGWYTSSDKFSLTSGTSGVYVAPTTSDPVDPPEEPDDCINVLENTSPVIADLDCGEGDNPNAGLDICAVTDKNVNGYGEDTDKPSSYILNLGALSDTLVTSDTTGKVVDKVEVGALGGTDDGDGSYYVVVSDQNDPTNALTDNFFAGTVEQGDNFEAAGSFGSQTFVHIFASDGGSALQTINFHTSCSSPLIIGDQYGTITLEGATLEGKDTGTIYSVGQTEADGDAGVVYGITGGNDADDFTVDPDTGEVTFISPPDFENPTDSDGDNKYDVEVTAFFLNDDGSKGDVCEVKQLEVCVEDDCINVLENTSPVIADLDCGEGDNPNAGLDICAVTDKNVNGYGEDTDKPSSYILNLGALSDTLVTSDTTGKVVDKVEVGALGGTDDGDGSYYVVVSDQNDPTNALTDNFFAGTVEQGDNFEAAGSFGSQTFVHIFASDGGSALQTINFHTSCSSPLIIGDQYGTITLEGATLEGKDTGTIYSVGQTEADGDAGVVYGITGGNDADDFTVDPDTGEVTFISPPDFENPTDSDGDNKYDVEVTAFFLNDDGSKGDVCEVKQLEVCVEDQDCISILENTDPGVVADLDCEDTDPENPDDGLDLCEERDSLRDSGVDASKLTQLTLSLGETLTSESSTDQNGKLDVGEVQPGDDGDGLYFIRVSNKDNPDDTSESYFEGLVNAGESFTFASAPERNEFSSETRVHIFDQDGIFLQSINFHTSCSAPIAIGDQYGSVTLEGGAFTDKDTGKLIEYGGTSTPREVVYEITAGDGYDEDTGTSPFFDVDPATGEVTLAFAPDYEDPLDDNMDNNYFVEVTGYFINADGSREVCEVKPIEICIEDEVEVGSLSGRYFCDENDNDVDDGEPGIEGVTVQLLAAGVVIATTTTAADGSYSFGDLEAGIYDVKFTDPTGAALDGKQLVNPNDPDGNGDDTNDSDAVGNTSMSVIEGIEVKAGADTPDNDAGAEKTASLGDKVFFDTDRDGVQDAGEGGVAGVTVTLTGGGDDGVIGTADDTTAEQTTDANGEYLFDGLNPGEEYKVTFSNLPTDTEFTVQDAGGDDAADSDADPTNGMTQIVTLDPGEENLTLDAGIVSKLGSLSGRYFCDENDNDVDDGEPGIEGVTVQLLAAGVVIATTTTAADGSYSFGDLEAGIYDVKFTDPTGAALDGKQLVNPNDPDGNGDDTNDSDAVGNTSMSVIEGIEVKAGADTPDNDAGAEKTASLGDKVFFDTDRDGVQDAGEGGVAGVTVTLTGGGDDGVIGTADDTTAEQTTDANGEYLFDGLNPGEEYKVTFSNLPTDTEFTVQDAGGDDAADSDADPTNGMTQIVTLDPGEENLTLDAGIVSKLGSLSGRYFCDENDNDVDDGEPGIEGVTVQLLAAGVVIATTTTAADGSYSFGDLEAGIYDVKFTDPTGAALDGKQLVNPNDPDGNGDDTNDSDAVGNTSMSVIEGIEVKAGADTPDNDAGAEKTASLGDKVFFDTDRDGVQDAGEGGVAGVTVTLTGGGDDGVIGTADDTTAEQTTDANGEYLFDGLNPGEEYKVTFSNLPTDTEFTVQDAGGDDAADSDADPTNGMTQIVTLDPGEENLTLDAGIVSKLGSLSGRYFCDENDNDVDDGEPGIEGVTVQLLAAGVVIATTTTAADGSYSFGDLEAGIYDVKFTDPTGAALDGKQLVNPNDPDGNGDDTNDSDAVGNTSMSVIEGIEVKAGADTPDNDAGAEKTASLGDKVFFDTDRDGVQDAGEGGVAGVTVTLTGGGDDGVIGTADDTTAEQTTDANGEYLFDGLNPGEEYKVTFSNLPTDTEFTVQDAGGDDAADSDADPTNGMTQIVTLDPGEENLTLDAGIVSKLGSLSGRYFCDENDNDVDDGEPGIEGVTVQLLAAGVVIATTTTAADGSYSFGDLEAGIYDVKFTDPTGAALDGKQLVNPNDPDGNGDDTNDSDAVGNTSMSVIEGIEVKAGADTPDNDAGAEKTASLGDKVFFDTDRDGVQDAGEGGVAGVTVTLTGGGDDGVIGTADDTTAEQTTDANGEYLFDGLNPGEEYKVTFSNLPTDTEFTVQDAGGDDAADSDADPTNGMTQIVTLDPGEENLTLDAGIVSKLGSLSGRYFCDENDNDVDDGEPGIEGVTVQLLAAGVVIATTTTAADGSYSFGDLEAGIYDVKFTDPTGAALDGKQLVNPNDPDGNGDDTNDSDAVGNTSMSVIEGIEVKAGADTPDNDAGAEKTASLGDKVFFDTDRDGVQDAGEGGVAGVTVTLTGGGDDGVIGTADDTTAEQTTDANGEYLFDGLNPGEEYKVTFSNLPTDTEFTVQDAGGDDAADSDADPTNGMTQIVTLDPGEENLTLDAGIVSKLGSLSGRYFCDENDNDVDDGEPGIEGVTVQLLAAGVVIATTTTAADGSYSFGDLEAGIYDVKFTDPTGAALDGKQLVNPNDPDGNGDDTNDSDAVGNTSMSVIEGIEVKAGADTPDNDAGAEKTASLGDKVFFDTDRDGVQDAGEGGVAGVTVTLTGGGDDGVIGTADDTTAEQTTDANGEYLFDGLNPGEEYKVTFSNLPTDTEFTVQDAGGDDAADSDADPTNGMTQIVTLDPGEENLTLDAGIVSKLGSLSGRYFCDDDRDGLDNDGVDSTGTPDGSPSDGIEGVTVTLLDASGNPTGRTTTTDANGNYAFLGLIAGIYGVKFTDDSGKILTTQNVDGDVSDGIDSDAFGLGNGMSEITGIVVVAGQNTPDNDAGVYPNDAPDVTDDAGKGCADEDIRVDFSDNYSDADSASASITMINGQAITDGGPAIVVNGVEVSLVNDEFIFNGETAYAGLDIGEEATEIFTVKVEDSDGAASTASIGVTFCGDANSVDSFYASLPASGTYEVEYAVDDDAPFPAFAFDLRFLDTGDARLDGVLFEKAYCLDFATAVRTVAQAGPDNAGAIFGSQSAAALSAFDDSTISNANGLAGSENLDLINWVIAQDFEDQGSSGWAVQFAIWELADNFDSSLVDYSSFQNTEQADVQAILDTALLQEGFELATGDTVGVIVDPGLADPDNVQPFIVALDWESNDCLC